jgi:hypothetical protein
MYYPYSRYRIQQGAAPSSYILYILDQTSHLAIAPPDTSDPGRRELYERSLQLLVCSLSMKLMQVCGERHVLKKGGTARGGRGSLVHIQSLFLLMTLSYMPVFLPSISQNIGTTCHRQYIRARDTKLCPCHQCEKKVRNTLVLRASACCHMPPTLLTCPVLVANKAISRMHYKPYLYHIYSVWAHIQRR